MWRKLSNTQRFILIGMIVLIIVDIVLWANVAKLRSPFSKFEDALNAGNVKKACENYKNMTGSYSIKRPEAEKMAAKYAKISISDYLEGKATYEKASTEVYALKESVLENDNQIDANIAKMEEWHDSETAFEAAEEAKAMEEYETAILLYESVSENYTKYEAAQNAIKECKELQDNRARIVIEEAAAMINVERDIHTYLDAIRYMDHYIDEHPGDLFVPQKREQFLDEYYNLQLKNIDTLKQKKEYEMALSIAEELVILHPTRTEAKELVEELKEKEEK